MELKIEVSGCRTYTLNPKPSVGFEGLGWVYV